MAMNRREFLKEGVVISTATALGALTLAGCTPTDSAESRKSTETGALPDTSAYEVAETLDTDIVIVGAGISGIAAAVQAGENGDSVVLIDWANEIGGAGIGVEGMFGCDSPLQKELGITFDPNEVVAREVANSNYLVDAAVWRNLVNASGDNIAWLIDQGVEFSGVVDDYPIAYPDGTVAKGVVQCFHWFGGGSAYENFDDSMAGGSCYKGYVLKMAERIDEYGIDVRLNTRGTDLVFDEEGAVAGVYALKDDGTYLKVQARAVVIATGGILNDADRLRARGLNPDRVLSQITPGSSGDGARMAIDQAGAREYFRTAYEGWNGIPGSPISWTNIGVNLGFGGPVLWVNEFAERFTNENLGVDNFDLAFVPRQQYQEQYVFVSKQFAYEKLMGNDSEMIADWERRMQEDSENAWEGQTVEEVAEAAGLDPEKLRETVDRYNELCRKGEDSDFLKPADKMVEFAEGPYLLYATSYALDSSFGDVCVDRFFRAVTPANEPIENLYVIGVEGCMLYSNVYRIDIPGSGCANSVNSGRIAANHIHENVLG